MTNKCDFHWQNLVFLSLLRHKLAAAIFGKQFKFKIRPPDWLKYLIFQALNPQHETRQHATFYLFIEFWVVSDLYLPTIPEILQIVFCNFRMLDFLKWEHIILCCISPSISRLTFMLFKITAFFSIKVQKTQFFPNIFLICEKALESFWSIWVMRGRISKIARSRQIIHQSGVLDVKFPES